MPVGLLATAKGHERVQRRGALLHHAQRAQGGAEGGQGAGVQQAEGRAVGVEERDCAGGADHGRLCGFFGGGWVGGGGGSEGDDCAGGVRKRSILGMYFIVYMGVWDVNIYIYTFDAIAGGTGRGHEQGGGAGCGAGHRDSLGLLD